MGLVSLSLFGGSSALKAFSYDCLIIVQIINVKNEDFGLSGRILIEYCVSLQSYFWPKIVDIISFQDH